MLTTMQTRDKQVCQKWLSLYCHANIVITTFFSIKLSFSEQIFSEFAFLFFLKQRTYKHNIPDFEMNFKHDFGN